MSAQGRADVLCVCMGQFYLPSPHCPVGRAAGEEPPRSCASPLCPRSLRPANSAEDGSRAQKSFFFVGAHLRPEIERVCVERISNGSWHNMGTIIFDHKLLFVMGLTSNTSFLTSTPLVDDMLCQKSRQDSSSGWVSQTKWISCLILVVYDQSRPDRELPWAHAGKMN